MTTSTGKLFQYGKNFAGLVFRKNNSSITFCNTSSRLSFSSGPPPPIGGEGSKEPFIPAYEQRQGEPVQTLKARLLYQSRKRGMLENGLLLSTFAARFLDSMNEVELKDYDRLINVPSNDWDIYYWATGVKPIPKEFDTDILHKFIAHVRNADKESRIRQPDLRESDIYSLATSK